MGKFKRTKGEPVPQNPETRTRQQLNEKRNRLRQRLNMTESSSEIHRLVRAIAKTERRLAALKEEE
jgi:methionyl-tRNA formyltransferase